MFGCFQIFQNIFFLMNDHQKHALVLDFTRRHRIRYKTSSVKQQLKNNSKETWRLLPSFVSNRNNFICYICIVNILSIMLIQTFYHSPFKENHNFISTHVPWSHSKYVKMGTISEYLKPTTIS
jgi:hypothetical protein